MDKVAMWIGYIFIGLVLLGTVFNRPDNSDKNWFTRSGLSIYTDHLTGLQYIKGGIFGGITPRLNQDGSQVKYVK